MVQTICSDIGTKMRTTRRRTRRWAGGLLLASTALAAQYATPAIAADTSRQSAGQTAEADMVGAGDIIVTATRRAEPLSKVAISATAFDQATLDTKGVRSITDISRISPSLNFSQRAPRKGADISIRGITSRVGASTTGIYIDETPIQVRYVGSFADNVFPQIFDLERVEVLRGPQGTLFGAGSMGGTVRFITPQPDMNKTSGYARAEISDTRYGGLSYEGGAAVGIPLVTDKIAFRGSFWARREGGVIDRADPDTGAIQDKNIDKQTSYVARAALAIKPSDSLTLTPSVFYQRIKSHDTSQFWTTRSFLPVAAGPIQPSSTFTLPFSDYKHGVLLTGDQMPSPGVDRFVIGALKAEVNLDGVDVIGNVSYFDRASDYFFDYSTAVAANVSSALAGLGVPLLSRVSTSVSHADQQDTQKNWTAELRVQSNDTASPFNWVAGLFYAHQRQRALQGIGGEGLDAFVQALTGDPTLPGSAFFGPNYQPGNLAIFADNRSLDEQFAGFLDVSYSITEQLKATAGVRISRTTVDVYNAAAGPFASGPLTSSTASSKATPITPKFSLSYQIDDANMLYASAAKGFRIGGGNPILPAAQCAGALAAIGLTDTPSTFASDSLWSYEIGSKNKVAGGKVSMNASAFYIDWKNLQQQVFLPCQYQYVDNVGSATSKGFELQFSVTPVRALSLGAALSYTSSKYTSTAFPGTIPGAGPGSVIVSDGDTIGDPPWRISLNGDYEFPFGQNNSGYVHVDYTYQSHNSGQSPVQNPLSVSFDPAQPNLPALQLVNLRAGVRLDDRIDASLFVNNLFDETKLVYIRHELPGNLLFKNTINRPRTIGLTLTYRQ